MTRRALVALPVAALAVALLASAGQIGDAGAATSCVRHAKRVVLHVKRQGKVRRVVHLKHWWTCQEAAAPSASPTPPAATAPGAPSPPTETPTTKPTEPEPEANAIGVAADDHGGVKSYTLSRQTVRAGRLTVQLNNKGEDPHDMDMQRVGPAGEPLGEVVEIPVTGPGEQKTQSFEVEAGRYRMWCNLYHHAAEGMEATITVE